MTKEADYLLCALYKGYLEKRKAEKFRENAAAFGEAEEVQAEFAQTWPVNDIEDAVRELSRAKLVSCVWANNTFSEGVLTSEAIIYMENRFDNKLNRLLQRITAIRSSLLK